MDKFLRIEKRAGNLGAVFSTVNHDGARKFSEFSNDFNNDDGTFFLLRKYLQQRIDNCHKYGIDTRQEMNAMASLDAAEAAE